MSTKNFKNSFLLLLASLLVDVGDLLKETFSYSEKKPPKEPPTPQDTTPEDRKTEIEDLANAPAMTPPDGTTQPPAASAPVDQKGVAFDPVTCGKAKEPFYASGPRAGQWKKRKGVTDGSYDAWYANCVPAAATQATPPADNIAAGQFGATDSSVGKVPATLGEFMAWVSEQQTAGKVTPELVHQAYVETGTTFVQVNDPITAASAVKALWMFIKARI